jgi:hypothetical protein
VLKIWENYITELHDRPNRPVFPEFEPEEEVGADEKGPYILQSEVEKAIKEIGTRRLQEIKMYRLMSSNYWKTCFKNNDKIDQHHL